MIRVPTGTQDHYPPAFGGASAIHLEPGGERREEIGCDLDELERRLVLCYTGKPKQHGINNWEVFARHIRGDKRVFRNFEEITKIARGMREALVTADWNSVARLLKEEWKLRRTNAPGITTPLIDELIRATAKAGARGAKVCGAGGGGCVVFFVEPDARERVAEVIRSRGAHVLPCRVQREGVTVTPTRAAAGKA